MNKAARSEKDAQNVAQIKTENERTRSPVAMRESLFLRLNNVSICTGQNEKKRSERRKHCALAVVRRGQKFSPRRRPLPGGAGRPKFNQLEMVTTFT